MIEWTEKDEAKMELTKKRLARLRERKRLSNELRLGNEYSWSTKGNRKLKSSFSCW